MNDVSTYIEEGWPVLALYTTILGRCTCGRDDCPSPGKHPRADLCPRGVYDATTDAAKARAWAGLYNIGVALGRREVGESGLMVLDVDDPEVALRLKADLPSTLVSKTGSGGLHIWFRVKGVSKTFLLRTEDGRHLGEVRGDGAYVVVPPSETDKGVYEWLRTDAGVVEVEDAAVWVREVLSARGIEVGSEVGWVAVPDVWDEIDEVGIPLDLVGSMGGGSLLGQVLKSGALGEGNRGQGGSSYGLDMTDRSGKLYRIAAEIVEADESLEASYIAGVVKRIDRLLYRKYVDRRDCDRYYWAIANKVVAGLAGVGGSLPGSDYIWDGEWLYYHSGRIQRRVANFRPKVVRDIVIDYGDGITERAWEVEVARPRTGEGEGSGAETMHFFVRNDTSKTFSQMFEAAIREHCPVEFVVSAGMGHHLVAATQLLSGTGVEKVRTVGSVGWHRSEDGRLAYVLPGMVDENGRGMGIGKDGVVDGVGIDVGLLGERSLGLVEVLSGYGARMGKAASEDGRGKSEVWKAFRTLVRCGKPRLTMVIVCQILAGPLYRGGVGLFPPLVHVMGRTGSFKTTYCLAALSLFGDFARQPPPANWHSTANSLRALLHECRDLTLLIDDYRTESMAGGEGSGVSALINTYTERTARMRLSGSQELRKGLNPRGLILSNGEDTWERAAATTARTIVIDLDRGGMSLGRISEAQDYAERGVLAAFGCEWLSWLAKYPRVVGMLDRPEGRDIGLLGRIQHWLGVLPGMVRGSVHPRLYGMIASLFVTGEILCRFVRETWGDGVTGCAEELEVLGWLDEMSDELCRIAEERGRDVEQASPLNLLIDSINGALSSGAARIRPYRYSGGRYGGGRGEEPEDEESRLDIGGGERSDVVGYYWDRHGGEVLLTENTTYAWYERLRIRSGGKVEFSWRAVVKEVERRYGAESKRQAFAVYNADGSFMQVRGVLVPLKEFVGWEAEN